MTELVITGTVEGYCDVETGVCVPAADEAAPVQPASVEPEPAAG